MSATTSDRPIFITACPRSGTTLLQLMLHSHPQIGIPPETRFFMPTYRSRLRFGDLEVAANREAVADFIARPRHRFSHLGLDPETTKRAIVGAPPTLGSALGPSSARTRSSTGGSAGETNGRRTNAISRS